MLTPFLVKNINIGFETFTHNVANKQDHCNKKIFNDNFPQLLQKKTEDKFTSTLFLRKNIYIGTLDSDSINFFRIFQNF